MNKIYPKLVKQHIYSRKHQLNKKLFNLDKNQKHLIINGFNIIELNEEKCYMLSLEEHTLTKEEILKIKKKAKSIENYYILQSDDSIIKENCFICLLNGFSSNELLYFNKKKDLLIYIKYCFYFLQNVLFLDNDTYLKNKYDLEKMNLNYLKGWKFYVPKMVCRSCFLQIINMENLFSNLKNIFIDIIPKHIYKNRNLNRRFNNKIKKRKSFSLRASNDYDKVRKNKKKLNEKCNINISQKPLNKIKNKDSNIHSNDNPFISSNIIKIDLLSLQIDNIGNNDNFDKINFKNEDKIKMNIKKENPILNEDIISHSDESKEIEISIKNDFIDKESTPEEELKNSNDNCINTMNDINSNKNKDYKSKVAKKRKRSSYTKLFIIKSLNSLKIKKYISNKITIKLYYKTNVLKDSLFYLLINIELFKEMLFNCLLLESNNSISDGIQEYEKYFIAYYNMISKIKESYDNIIFQVKKHSIPMIMENILQLKQHKNITSEEIQDLEEMEKNLTDYNSKIDEIKNKYDSIMNNFFLNFFNFIKISEEFKANYKEKEEIK